MRKGDQKKIYIYFCGSVRTEGGVKSSVFGMEELRQTEELEKRSS